MDKVAEKDFHQKPLTRYFRYLVQSQIVMIKNFMKASWFKHAKGKERDHTASISLRSMCMFKIRKMNCLVSRRVLSSAKT